MTREHKCIPKVDEQLAPKHTKLSRNLLNPNHLIIATEPTVKRRRAVTLFASYCPFCGKKLRGV